VIANLTTAETITGGVIVFFALLALVTIIRVILRREDATWRGLRVGFFVERDRKEDERS